MPRISRPEIRALKAPYPTQKTFETAEAFAMHVLNDPDAPAEMKVRLARALLRVQEPRIKPARPGVKARKESAAKEAAAGAFEPPPLPKRPH